MREWALERWTEGSLIDLTHELPRIKAEIKLDREQEELRLQQEQDDVDGVDAEETARYTKSAHAVNRHK